MRILILISLLLVLGAAITYDIKLNDDGFDVLLKNRFTKLGWGIQYKDDFSIWHFAHTVRGGTATKQLYPDLARKLRDKDQAGAEGS